MINNLSIITFIEAVKNNTSDLDPGLYKSEVINYILNCGLGPLFFNCIQGSPHSKEHPYYSLLLGSSLTSQILIGNHVDSIRNILQIDPSMTERVVLLKGISTSLRYYPAPYMRTMGDIDILVHKDFQNTLENICKELGYHQESTLPDEFYETHHHTAPYYNSTNKVWIEIHSALFSSPSTVCYDNVFSINNIFNETIYLDIDGINACFLKPEFELVYICSHWAEAPNWMKSLTQLLDMILIINANNTNFDWAKILKWTDDSMLAPQLFIVMSFLKKHDLATIPDIVIEELSDKNIYLNAISIYILHTIMEKYILSGKPFGRAFTIHNIDIIWSTLLLGKNPALIKTLIILPLNLLFPPNNKHRFSLLFQFKRLKSLLARKQ